MGLGLGSAGVGAQQGIEALIQRRLQEQAQAAEITRSEALTRQGDELLASEEAFNAQRARKAGVEADLGQLRLDTLPDFFQGLGPATVRLASPYFS